MGFQGEGRVKDRQASGAGGQAEFDLLFEKNPQPGASGRWAPRSRPHTMPVLTARTCLLIGCIFIEENFSLKCPKHKVSDREPPLEGPRLESTLRRGPIGSRQT